MFNNDFFKLKNAKKLKIYNDNITHHYLISSLSDNCSLDANSDFKEM